MCYKFALIALSALICALSVHSAAVDPTLSTPDLVVEKQDDGEQPVVAIDVNNVPEQCHQPKETGRCFALFYRFAYNVDTNSCEEFIYGGCAGNSNNFETKEQCEQLCLGKSVSVTEQSTESTTEQQTELSVEMPTTQTASA